MSTELYPDEPKWVCPYCRRDMQAKKPFYDLVSLLSAKRLNRNTHDYDGWLFNNGMKIDGRCNHCDLESLKEQIENEK